MATTPSSTVPGAPTTAPGAPPAGGLADSEPLPTARSDQLLSFSRFTARNPFVAPGGAAPPPSGTSQLTNTAVIEVNGQSEEVVYGAAFPTADPVFRLANVTESGVEVGLASGSFDDGRQSVAIAIGEQVQLVGDDGTSYTVKVVSVDFKLPCVPGRQRGRLHRQQLAASSVTAPSRRPSGRGPTAAPPLDGSSSGRDSSARDTRMRARRDHDPSRSERRDPRHGDAGARAAPALFEA